jgi:hypothetical protein
MLVRVGNPQHARAGVWFFTQPEYFEYSGELVKNLKGTGPDQLCLTTGNPEWPVRVIQRRLILSIDHQPYSADTASEVKRVKGSKGQEYVVTHANALWHCTCPGFTFRGHCKHSQATATA